MGTASVKIYFDLFGLTDSGRKMKIPAGCTLITMKLAGEFFPRGEFFFVTDLANEFDQNFPAVNILLKIKYMDFDFERMTPGRK